MNKVLGFSLYHGNFPRRTFFSLFCLCLVWILNWVSTLLWYIERKFSKEKMSGLVLFWFVHTSGKWDCQMFWLAKDFKIFWKIKEKSEFEVNLLFFSWIFGFLLREKILAFHFPCWRIWCLSIQTKNTW